MEMVPLPYLILASAIVATNIVALPRKRDLLETVKQLLDNTPKGQYEKLFDFLPDEERHKDPEFWNESERLRGLWIRLHISFNHLRAVQVFKNEKVVTKNDARRVWKMMGGQTIYTAAAVFEAALCHFMKEARHVAALESVRFHCQLVVRANVLCEPVDNDAPKCMGDMQKLL
jgi:hypothetical protein